jgi:TonB family protein
MRVHALRLHSQAQPVPPLRTMGLESFDLFPRPQDVLADAPLAFAGQKERGTTSLGETTRGMPLGESAAEDRNPVHTDLVTNEKPPPSVERIGWEGQARTLIRKQDPSFPPTLGAEGQEVECEARIVVAPNGTVIHVEITKSSGYTEIDTSVESALRAYLFSRGDARKEAVGTIRFRFRLEKRD